MSAKNASPLWAFMKKVSKSKQLQEEFLEKPIPTLMKHKVGRSQAVAVNGLLKSEQRLKRDRDEKNRNFW